ncbi:MAG: PPC domain-containing protein [Planctomycetota bacterium]|nr:PPC domain-containing protein [Planctomycetota bacterium]
MHSLRFAVTWWVSCFLLLLANSASAQLPATRLDGLFPAGASPGQTVDVTIFGGDLDDVDKLQFSHVGITAARKMAEPTPFDEGPQPIENQFTLTIAGDVPAGRYTVRCQGKYGLSGPRTFMVDTRQEIIEIEPNADAEQATEVTEVPAVINGQLNGAADLDWFKFPGKAGQRLFIVACASQLDSPATIVLSLTTDDGRVLGESRRVGINDPSLDVKLPADGTYWLRVRDLVYAGGGDYVYRVVIGGLPAIDFVFPPAGLPGSNDEYTIYGRNLPGGQASSLTRNGQPLEQVNVRIPIPGDVADKLLYADRLEPHQAGLDGVEYRVASPAGSSNAALVTAATAPVVGEQDNNDTPQMAQKLTLPCEVAGQFFPQRDLDWYTFDAKAGDEYWIEVYSHRLGAPTDAALVVLRVETNESGEEKVTQLAWVDDVTQRDGGFEFDQRTHDPVYQFKAPVDGTYRILVREGYSSVVSDPSLVYRLAVRPAKPDYRLAMTPMDSSGELFLRKGGRVAVTVVVFRQDGFAGEIRLAASGLPAGVTAPDVIVGPDSTQAVFVLSAAADAAPAIGELQLVGQANIGGAEVTRTARASHPLANVPFAQPNNAGQASLPARLTDKLPVVISESETDSVVLALQDPATVETSRGGIVKLKYKVTRQDGAGGNITGFAFGLPRVMNVPQAAIGTNAEGEFELRFPANMTPGTYTTNLAAMIQGVNYSRNPEAAAQAKERQDRIAKIFTESQQKAQQAQQTVTQSQATLTQANTLLTQATTAKTTTEQAATAMNNALKAAEDALAAVKKQLEAKPDDDGLKQQVAAAEKVVADATPKAKAATDAAAEAVKKLEEVTKNQLAAQEAKTKADEDLKAAQQFQQLAQQEKTRADQKAQQLQQQANKRGINHIIFATPVTISVADYPIKLTGPAEKVAVKQGEKLEIPLKVERLFGFNQGVNFQLIVPGGVGGLQIQNVNLAGDKPDGVINITAQPTATPGEHSLTLRATMNFNGQNLTLDQTFVLSVAPVEAAK